MRAARADLRRRRRGGEAADDGLHERRAGEDARVPPQRTGDIRACRRQGNMETVIETRNAEVGTRNRRLALRTPTCCSAFRVPRSAFGLLALLTLVCTPVRSPAQQWPVHSLDRPRPPVVDPGPERPSVPPPA